MVARPEDNVIDSASDLRNQARDSVRVGDFSKAVELLKSAAQLEPDHLPTRVNLGAALQSMGRHAEALQQYDHALTLEQNRPEVLSNRSVCLVGLGRLTAAIDSARSALKLRPAYPEALNNLGAALHAAGDFSGASACFREAVTLRPDYVKALANLGFSLQGLGLLQESLQELQEAFDKGEQIDGLPGALLHLRMRLCDWDHYYVDRDRLLKSIERGERVADPFVALGVFDNPSIHRRTAAIMRAPNHRSLEVQRWKRKIAATGKIKVGYVSADFSNHATTHLIYDLIRLHDRRTVEVVGFSLGVVVDDLEGRRIREAFDTTVDLHDLGDEQVVKLVRDMGIDIAIDLKGYTRDARPSIFERRIAPIQASFLGYPGTMASPTMDYLIADRVVIPGAERNFYDEKIVYLPGSYQVNRALEKNTGPVPSRERCGLPSEGVVFCCFNNTFKITPDVFARWMRILAGAPDSVLWLLGDNNIAIRNLRTHAASAGVDSSRLIFAARAPINEHLGRHRLADIFLDTAPYNAHTTASDSLRVGVPVITLPGRSFQSRVVASLLASIDASDLVANTPEEYERLAIQLATNHDLLNMAKQRIARGVETSVLFQPSVFARNLEKAFAAMVARESKGLPPVDIHI